MGGGGELRRVTPLIYAISAEGMKTIDFITQLRQRETRLRGPRHTQKEDSVIDDE